MGDATAATKTITTVHPRSQSPHTVDEYFFVAQSKRTDPNSDLHYRQYSEYNVDVDGKSIEKVNTYVDFSDGSGGTKALSRSPPRILPPTQQSVVDIKDLKRSRKAKFKQPLSQSTIEMTSVVKNKTSVQGITVKESSPDRFTIHIVNPSGVQSVLDPQVNQEGAFHPAFTCQGEGREGRYVQHESGPVLG